MSHEDKAFMSSFVTVLAGLVVVAVVFYVIANLVTGDSGEPVENSRKQAKIQENIKPVGTVNVGSAPAAGSAAAAGPRSGQQVYSASCLACHSTGVAGAPKVGDAAAWGTRVAKGIDGLLGSAVNGLNAMPPKGTCADCSDDELKAAIEYMLKETGV